MKHAEKSTGQARVGRRVGRRILLGVSIVLVVLVAAFLVARAMFPAEKLKELAVSKLEEGTGLDITVRDAGLSFVHWRLGIKVTDVEVSMPGESEKLATIPELGASLAILPLFRREIVVDGVYIERPRINIVTGQPGLPGTPSGSVGRPELLPALSLQLPKAVVTDAEVVVRDLKTGQEVRIEKLDVSSSVKAGKGLESLSTEGKFSVESVSVKPAQTGAALPPQRLKGTWRAKFGVKEELLEVQSLSLQLAEVPIQVKGTVDLSKSALGATAAGRSDAAKTVGPEVDLVIELEDVSVAKLISLAPQEMLSKMGKVKAEGVLNATSRVRGRLPLPEIETDFSLSAGNVTKVEGRLDLETAEPQVVTVKTHGRARLEELQNVLNLGKGPKARTGEVLFDVGAKGRVAELKADPFSVELTGQVEGSSIGIEMEQAGPPVSVEKLKVKLLGTRAEISETVVRIGESRFDIAGSVDGWKKRLFTMSVSSPALDLKELLLPVMESKGKGGEKPPFVAPLPPAALGMNGVVTLGVEKMSFGDFRAQDLKARFVVGGDSLSVTEATMRTLGGVVGGSGRLNLPPEGEPTYTGSFSAKEIQLGDLLDSLTPLKGLLQGATFFEIGVQGKLGEEAVALRSVAGSGQVKTSSVSAIGSPLVSALAGWVGLEKQDAYRLKDFVTGFSVQDGRLIVPACSLVEKNSTWTFSGSTGFDATLEHKVSVTFSPEYSKKLGGLKGLDQLVKDEQGRVILDLLLGGTVKKPAVRWDTSRMERRAKDLLARKVKNELEKRLKTELGVEPDAKKQLEEEAAKLKEEAETKGKKLLEDLLKKNK